MKTFVIAIISILVFAPYTSEQKNYTSILFDFDSKETSGNWYVINDDVMGGISRSEVKLQDEGYVNFHGVVSPENNGGFASIRARIEMDSENEYKPARVATSTE